MLPAYGTYRESGIEWIGKLPSHWEVAPLKRLAGRVTGAAAGRTFAVALENIESWTGRYIPRTSEHSGDGTAFEPDDILFGKLRPYLAKAWMAHRSGEAVGDFHVMRCHAGVVPKFVHRLLLAPEVISLVHGSTYGAKMPRASWSFLGSIAMPRPPNEEQQTIVRFLEVGLEKLDALVEDQGRLIRLLDEKREAIISRFIVSGVDASAPTKHSGIDWVGDIPVHWHVKPLMRLTDPSRPIMYGIVLPGPDVDDGIPIVKGGNVKPSRLNLDSLARTTPELEAPYARARLVPGDLVYSIRGSIGDCEVVPDELPGANITQDVARVAADTNVCVNWLRYALLSAPVREALACGSLGAAVRGVNIFDLKRVRIPTPPFEEQVLISKAITHALEGVDGLTAEAKRSIALIKERRGALVSAAVTGKIDVRGFATGLQEAA